MQPEDAAKEVNLRPPKFFVATSASQRNIDSPRGSKPSVLRTTAPPVVIVSYGSSSTPTAHNFHHGVYALAQPEMAFQVQPMHEPLVSYRKQTNTAALCRLCQHACVFVAAFVQIQGGYAGLRRSVLANLLTATCQHASKHLSDRI